MIAKYHNIISNEICGFFLRLHVVDSYFVKNLQYYGLCNCITHFISLLRPRNS